MKKLLHLFIGLLLFSYQVNMVAQSSIKKCGSSNYYVEGYLTNNSSTQPGININYETGNVKQGDYGELSVYFEESIFGMRTNGWLVIAEVEVTSKQNSQADFKVIEKRSVITVNNKEKSHFIKGKPVKFTCYEKAVTRYHKEYFSGTTSVHSVGNLVCDTKIGYWKYYNYDEKGGIYKEGSYDSLGQKEGLWEEYYDNGNLHFEFSYHQDKLTGISKTYYESGSLLSQISYLKNEMNGDYLTYYENGHFSEKGSCKNGKKEGIITTYDSTGVLKYERAFENGEKNGITKTFYPNGQVEQTGNYIHSQKEGQWLGYYPNGKLMLDYNYKNGELHGSIKEYYDNGNIKFEGTRENGIKVGIDKGYYDNGQLEYEEEIEIHRIVVYHTNGKIKEIIFRDKDDLFDGPYSSFYENGKPKEDGHYKNGQKVGKWKTCDEKGKKKMIKYTSDK